jgi:hypothetical protein
VDDRDLMGMWEGLKLGLSLALLVMCGFILFAFR